MWLASFRLAEVVALDHPLNPLRRELQLHGLCEEIVLDPFSETEVAEYVAERSPSIASDEAFVLALHERTDGLPLFIASIMSEMSARAAQSGGRVAPEQVAKIAVPENLAAIIEHYIAKLENEQRTLLSAAAVCGVQFRVNTIAAALERDAAWVGDTCDQLAREQLWLVSPRAEEGRGAAESPYSFRHALFRQVLYERAAPSARAQLHRKIGAALEREHAAGVPVTAAELAMHFERAGEATVAVRYYAEAAEAALANFSPEECMRIIERASPLLELAPNGPERNALQITIGTLQRPCRYPSAWRGQRSKERAPASVLAARRSSAASDARAPASRIRRSCFACARNMPRRSRSPIGRKRLDRRRMIRCLFRPRAPCMERSISFRVDRGPPGHGWSAGSLLPSGWTWVLENSWWIRRSPCSACSPIHSFIWAWSRMRAPACSAHMPALAIGDGRWRSSWQSGTARCSRCASATPSVWPLLPMRCTRSWRNSRSLTVELRVGGFAAGRTPEWAHRATLINGFGTHTKTTCASECSWAQARPWGMRPRRCCSPATWTERKGSSTKRCRSPASSASACICRSSTSWRLRSLVRVASARLPTPRFDARSRRPEPKRHRGSS